MKRRIPLTCYTILQHKLISARGTGRWGCVMEIRCKFKQFSWKKRKGGHPGAITQWNGSEQLVPCARAEAASQPYNLWSISWRRNKSGAKSDRLVSFPSGSLTSFYRSEHLHNCPATPLAPPNWSCLRLTRSCSAGDGILSASSCCSCVCNSTGLRALNKMLFSRQLMVFHPQHKAACANRRRLQQLICLSGISCNLRLDNLWIWVKRPRPTMKTGFAQVSP